MKNVMKRSFAVLMSLVICASMLFGLSFSAQAEDVTYRTSSDGYIYNWGTRETVATYLSQNAEAFYSDNGTSYEALSALAGSSTESGVPSSALFAELQGLMADNHDYITSYDATKTLFQYTDCENSGSPTTISSFYSGTAIGPSWNGGWNREHTWPNSKGDAAGSGENDLMMLRPTATSENSSRGNKAYGESSGYYHPNSESDTDGVLDTISNGEHDLRGDVARIMLYVYVRWDCTNTGSSYNSTGIFGTKGIFESKELLLKWIEEDPVDTWELGRNDSAESILGTRNVFVDYPELAFDLFEEAVPVHQTPSGIANGGTGTGGGDSGGDTDTDTGTDGDGTTGGDTTTETSGNYYVKVTEEPTDWSGEYLIVYETGSVAFNGVLTDDTAQNNISVTIDENKIPVTEATTEAEVTIEKLDSGYAIKVQNGNYISQSGTNAKLVYTTTAFAHNLSIDGAETKITNASNTQYMLMFNATSGQERFRYYKGTQKAIALYKLTTVEGGDSGEDSGEETPTYTITAESNDTAMGTVSVSGNIITASSATGYEASGYEITSGSATVTQDGNDFTVTDLTSDVTVQIIFTARVQNTVTFVENGETISTETVYNGDSITLPEYSGTLAENTLFKGWMAENSTEILLAGNTYTVTSDVTLTAQFVTVENVEGAQSTATITFDSTDKRTTLDSTQQVWKENNVTVTNNKTSDSTAVTDYYNPARFYRYSELVIEYPSPMTKIVVTTTSAGYADALINSVTDANAVATADGSVVTIVFGTPVESFTVNLTSGQVRAESMTIYSTETDGGETETETCTVTYVENDRVISKVKVEKGKTITLPTSIGTVNPETFEGWVLADDPTTIIKTYTVEADVTFYAKYKETESATASEATISFADTANRTSFSTTQQVWEQNGITVTNDKAGATSNVADYSNPVRFYKNSDVTIAYPGMTKIEVTASSASYATSLSNSLTAYTVSVTDKVVTISLTSAVDTLKITLSDGQVRVNSITVYTDSTAATTPTGKIEGAQIEVGESLALNYYVSLSNVADDAQIELRVTMLNKTTTIARDTGKKSEDGKYIFTFDKITTQCMTVPIDAELVLIDGESESSLSIKEDYSIQQNAINLLVAYPDDAALKQFVTDMLYYGAASQTYRGYNTDNLATSNVVDASGNNLLGNPSEALPSEEDAMSLVNNSDAIGDVYFRSATVWFDTINHLIIKLNSATENTELKLNGEVVMSGAGNTIYDTESIKATDFDTVYTFELYEDGTLIQTLSYSVNAYAYSKMNNSSNENMKNLAIALYRYGVSAKAYAESLK